MTREEVKEEAIAQLERISRNLASTGETVDYTDVAIEALEQEPCEDAIYRQAAIRLAEQGQVQGFAWQLRKLIALPSVRPTSKKGKWIENDKGVIVCSCCNTWFPRERKEFMLSCPYCSAEMENASNGRR